MITKNTQSLLDMRKSTMQAIEKTLRLETIQKTLKLEHDSILQMYWFYATQ